MFNPVMTAIAPIVKLEYSAVDDILPIVKKLGGLGEELRTENGDLSIVADSLARKIYVTGKPDRVRAFINRVKKIDNDSKLVAESETEESSFKKYRAGDPASAFKVIVTMLQNEGRTAGVAIDLPYDLRSAAS